MHSFVKNLMEQWMSDRMVDARDTIFRMVKRELSKHKPPESKEEREKLMAQCLKDKLEELTETRSYVARHLLRVPHYFEMVSTLVKRDPEALCEVMTLFRDSIIYWYKMFDLWIEDERKRLELPELLIEFENLYRQALTYHREAK